MKKLSLFLIVGRKTLRFEMALSVLIILLTFSLAVLIGFGYYSYQIVGKTVDIKELQSLRDENVVLRSKISSLVADIKEIKVILNDIYKTDQSIRISYGIELIDSELRSPGIGGKSKALKSMDDDQVVQLSREIDRLLATARFERESFEEIDFQLKRKFEILSHTPSIMPVNGILTSRFGPRLDPFTGRMRFHEGQDIAAPPGTPIVAPADGIITAVKPKRGYGLTIDIDHGYGIKTRYAHCMSARVTTGMRVKRGDVIGLVGTSGRATGPHLHYEVHVASKKVDPLGYIITEDVIVD